MPLETRTRKRRAALDRSSVSMRRPERAGRKDAPTPPPPIHTRRCALAQPPRRSWPPRRWDQLLVRHGSAAQQPAEGWCPTWVARLGVRRSASSLRVIRRAEALARRGRDHIREHLHGTQAGTPTRRLPAGVPPALRPGRSQRWLNAVPAASQRRRRACYASTFLDSKSQFSFLVSQWPGNEGVFSFRCADYQLNREFIITIPDSYFSIRAPASVQ